MWICSPNKPLDLNIHRGAYYATMLHNPFDLSNINTDYSHKQVLYPCQLLIILIQYFQALARGCKELVPTKSATWLESLHLDLVIFFGVRCPLQIVPTSKGIYFLISVAKAKCTHDWSIVKWMNLRAQMSAIIHVVGAGPWSSSVCQAAWSWFRIFCGSDSEAMMPSSATR